MRLKQLIYNLNTLAICLSIIQLNCAGQKQYTLRPIITEEKDRESIPRPEEKKISLYEDAIENIFGHEIDEYANISWHIRKLTNSPKQAKNLNAVDEVPNSSWFTNRHARHPMSLTELRRGPNRGAGPDVAGQLTVIAAKTEGVTPGFTVKDRRGNIYIIKFDSKKYPQLSTAAEVISTKFVYAAGYNTPENYLTTIDPKKLRIAENVMVKNRWGREVPADSADLQKWLTRAQRNPDGAYRVLASKFLEGKPIGGFLYTKKRKDDPNDTIPHQHRRELRGYKVIAAWLNNSDTKATNTLDMFVTQENRSYIRHYIIDFGTTLGASGYGLAGRGRGHLGALDLGNMLLRIVTLGLWVEPWEKEPRMISPSTGYFESRLFNPGNYAFITPVPAFQRATNLDGFWGAKIVMSFTDEQIRAIVETGEYANKDDEEYIIKILIERRDKTGRHWYSKVNPLDNFRLSENSTNHYIIEFDDLAVKAGFETTPQTIYRYRLEYQGTALTDYVISKGKPLMSLDSEMSHIIEKQLTEKTNLQQEDKILAFKIQTSRDGNSSWGKSIKVHFYYPFGNEKAAHIITLEREN